jgi:hypothetical protein
MASDDFLKRFPTVLETHLSEEQKAGLLTWEQLKTRFNAKTGKELLDIIKKESFLGCAHPFYLVKSQWASKRIPDLRFPKHQINDFVEEFPEEVPGLQKDPTQKGASKGLRWYPESQRHYHRARAVAEFLMNKEEISTIEDFLQRDELWGHACENHYDRSNEGDRDRVIGWVSQVFPLKDPFRDRKLKPVYKEKPAMRPSRIAHERVDAIARILFERNPKLSAPALMREHRKAIDIALKLDRAGSPYSVTDEKLGEWLRMSNQVLKDAIFLKDVLVKTPR